MARRPLAFALLLAAIPQVAPAQGLQEKISQLFIFGPGQSPLFLAGSATSSNPASIRAHGTHFLPSVAAENGSVIAFVTGALSASVANVPIGATTSGETFRFEGGVPVSTSTSAGPVFAERAQTLGRGRVLAGLNRSTFHFSTLRGVPLDDIGLVFTHENVDFEGCTASSGDDCKKMGVPVLENDVMQFKLALDINVAVTSFYVTYGLTDRLDFGVVLPVLHTRLDGRSDAQIIPFGGPTAGHFFAGTTADPELQATRSTSGSTTGIGDVAVRMKYNGHQTERTGIAFLADARFPTGDERDLLGAGKFAARGVAVASARFGAFSPHVNAGYLFRAGDVQNDAVLATVGFDHLLGNGVTLATDIVSEFQVGSSTLDLPRVVTYDAPFRRTVQPTSIPDMRDDLINGSFGFKFAAASRVLIVANALFPLNEGGLRARQTYTMGVEYAF
jgi:hypothetical protein